MPPAPRGGRQLFTCDAEDEDGVPERIPCRSGEKSIPVIPLTPIPNEAL